MRAEHCSYEFTAGKLYFGGVNGDTLESIDFEDKHDAAAVIKPGVLVWIRSREMVNMPADCVGLWVQTNTLSRQGLLLLNMSLVEPGYEGPLTAAFVNFGRVAVPINSMTKIAKLMFLELDGAAIEHAGSKNKYSYDASIEEIVARAPTTFLRVEGFLPDLGKAEGEAVKQINAAATEAKSTNLAALHEEKEKARRDITVEVEGDLEKCFWKMAGGFGVSVF